MLKKIYRLSSVKLTNPKIISGKYFSLKMAKNSLEVSRFGFVISKKLDKSAVSRNSLKRKLSSSVEEIFGRIDDGWDIVFYPRSIALGAPGVKITEELRLMLSKVGVLND